MKIITILLVLLFLIVLLGCNQIKPSGNSKEYIDYEEYSKLYKKHNNQIEEYNNLEEKLTRELNKCLVNNIIIEEKWESYLWKESNYLFYPTKCRYSKKIFTMCRSGCDIDLICSKSMYPLFSCDSKLTLAECTKYSLGDIVLVTNKDEEIRKRYKNADYIIHQIIYINPLTNEIITKGFNNYGIDNFNSTIFDIKGKVIKIEY